MRLSGEVIHRTAQLRASAKGKQLQAVRQILSRWPMHPSSPVSPAPLAAFALEIVTSGAIEPVVGEKRTEFRIFTGGIRNGKGRMDPRFRS